MKLLVTLIEHIWTNSLDWLVTYALYVVASYFNETLRYRQYVYIMTYFGMYLHIIKRQVIIPWIFKINVATDVYAY